MALKSVKELKVTGKAVLVRTGFDVSVIAGRVVDDFRLRAALPTFQHLVRQKAKLVIVSHRGRPAGWDEAFSLEPVARALAEVWERKLVVVPEASRKLPEYAIPHLYFVRQNLEEQNLAELLTGMRDGDAALLENLRFYPGETKNDPGFVKKLASLGEAYVNEAFSVSHRAHASITGVAGFLPAAAGLGLEQEVLALRRVTVHPKKPMVVMMGGVKLSDKAEALENLAKTADFLLLGGGLANLFLKVRGFEIGKSVFEEGGGEEQLAKQLWRDHRDKIRLPLDVVVSTRRDGSPECVKAEKVRPNQIILDIGPETIRSYSEFLKKAKTLIWGGPMGYFENKAFSHGTFALAWLLASRSAKPSVFGVAGGGQTLEVIQRLHLAKDIDCVSTGGGAMLEMLAGKTLPGLAVLEK